MRETLTLKSAHSFSNGIMFNSSSNPNYTTLVTIDEYQNIKAEWLPQKIAKKRKEEKPLEKERKKKTIKPKDAKFEEEKNRIISTIIFVLLTLPAFIPCILFDTQTAAKVQKEIFSSIMHFFTNPRFLLIALLLFLIIIILYAFMHTYIDDSTTRFHAAEHMIVNAYSKLHRIPSVEELSTYSRFHTCCGSNYMALILIDCIALLLTVIFKIDIYSCFIAILVSIVFKELGLLNFIQIITTRPPTEMELKVAIAGLKAWIENEQKSDENNFSDLS